MMMMMRWNRSDRRAMDDDGFSIHNLTSIIQFIIIVTNNTERKTGGDSRTISRESGLSGTTS